MIYWFTKICSLARLTNVLNLLTHDKCRPSGSPPPTTHATSELTYYLRNCSNLVVNAPEERQSTSEIQWILLKQHLRQSPTRAYPPTPRKKMDHFQNFCKCPSISPSQMDSGEVTDFIVNSIIQSLWSSWSSTVCMLTPLNHPPKCLHDSIFFTVDDNWIEFPQSGCPFPVCVWRVATVAGEFRPTLSFT